jgi:hypothetical protein
MATNRGSRGEKDKERRARQKRRKLVSRLIWGGAGLIAVILVGFFIWRTAAQSKPNGPEVGQVIPVTSRDHIPDGTTPGPYPSDPPAGGNHYAETLPTKFYQEADVASLPAHPEGYLVHNLEHGYIIFWYNCQSVSSADCTSLKKDIQTVMNENGNVKVIAFPWKSLDVPLVMTSWGRLERFKSPNLGLMRQFVTRNLNQSPEPDAS